MADLNEHVAYLAQEIGPRPAGTEEEQRAALYISEQLSSQPGLTCTMEDFQCNPDSSLPRGLVSAVAVVVTLLAMFVSVLAVPAAVIAGLCALLLAAEVFDKPVLSRMLNRGVSQNVVAKYHPVKSTNRASRRRKVVIVANYDSGKTRRDLSGPVVAVLPAVYWAELAAMVLMPVLTIVRLAMSLEGTALLAMNIVIGAAMVVAVLPALSLAVEKLSSYNEGANCNAAGVAVLMDVAARVAAARDLPDEPTPTIHGEGAALSAGLVPEGAEIAYEMGNTDADLGGSMESAAERLAAAKAAVAALTGKPVSATPEDEGEPAPEESPDPAAAAVEPAPAPAADAPADPAPIAVPVAAAPAAPSEPAIPDWFKQGQAQAKKPKKERPVQRSRYAVALERAEEEINAREQNERAVADELSERMRGMRASVQAASEAAGANPTGVIADLEDALAADAAASAAPSDAPAADGPAAAPAETPAPAPAVGAPAAPAEAPAPAATPLHAADPDATIAAPAIPVPPAPAAAPAPAEPPTVAALGSLPQVQPTDDPDVVLREGRRPLTGAAPTAATPGPAVPSPSPAADAGDSRRLVIPAVGEVPAAEPAQPARRRRAISLPNIGISQELPRISMDEHQQAAPLSEERPAHDGRVRDLSAVIPSVAAPSGEAALLGSMPSLAGASAPAPGLSGSINLAGAFTAMGATGAAAPLGDELIGAADEADLYIDDADDTVYAEQATETGAITGPGYVEMPKSRFGRLFGKGRRRASAEESTPQEWLDVEEGFDARAVGAARGGWESFREEDDGFVDAEASDGTTAFAPTYTDGFDDDFPAPRAMPRRGRHFEGGVFSRDMLEDPEIEEEEPPVSEPASVFAEGLPADFVFDATPEMEQIEQFRSDRIDMEVWFVALGSELAGNGGMRAFMEAHEVELKGSIFIELEALGAGELTLIEKEGMYLAKKASSRMKRLARKAGQAVGLKVGEGTMEWRDSASAYALKHGQQSMHLAGMDGRKPAFYAQEDDVLENIDSEMVALNGDFVMELLKHI